MAASGVVVDGGPGARLYDEVFALLVEAQSYLHVENSRLAMTLSTAYAAESVRLTGRLIDMMAWLLGRKAAERGEIDLDTCRQLYALGLNPRHAVTLTVTDRDALPMTLVSMLDRSLELYQRMIRLDRIAETQLLQNAPADSATAG